MADTTRNSCGLKDMLCMIHRRVRLDYGMFLRHFADLAAAWVAGSSLGLSLSRSSAAVGLRPHGKPVVSVRHFSFGSDASIWYGAARTEPKHVSPRTWLHRDIFADFPTGPQVHGPGRLAVWGPVEPHLGQALETFPEVEGGNGPARAGGTLDLPQAPSVNDWSHWSGDVGYNTKNCQNMG